jgi:osmotically-inducible protein OsmY
VRSVENRLDTRTATASAAPAATERQAEPVAGVDDRVITNYLKESLLGDPYLNNIDVAVVTRDGEVQLSGFVPNRDAADDVIAAARKIDGVKKVISTMTIADRGPQSAGQTPPEQQPQADAPPGGQ